MQVLGFEQSEKPVGWTLLAKSNKKLEAAAKRRTAQERC